MNEVDINRFVVEMKADKDNLRQICPEGFTDFQYGIFYEYIAKVAVDVQTLLRLLTEKGIITIDEVNEQRETVRKYKYYKELIDESLAMKTRGATEMMATKALYDTLGKR